MRGAVLYAPRDIRYVEREDPKIIQPTDAIVHISATCVCGSDLWDYRGINPITEPKPMGHEYCGIVEEVGSAVRSIKRGSSSSARSLRLTTPAPSASRVTSPRTSFGLPDMIPLLYRLLTGGAPVTLERLAVAGVDIIAGGRELAAVDDLRGRIGIQTALRRGLARLLVRWDIGLIDCPPNLGLLSVNALAAADEVLVPVETHGIGLSGSATCCGPCRTRANHR